MRWECLRLDVDSSSIDLRCKPNQLVFRGQNTLRALLIREEVSVDELLGVIAKIESAVRLA